MGVIDKQYQKSSIGQTKISRDGGIAIQITRERDSGNILVTTGFTVCNRRQTSEGSQVHDSPISECGSPDRQQTSEWSQDHDSPISECRSPDRQHTSDGGPQSDIGDPEGSPASPISECEPPDGGWGWAIAGGSLIFHILLEGFSRSLGLLFKTTLRVFDGTNAQTAVHQSLFNTLRMVLGKYFIVMFKRTYMTLCIVIYMPFLSE